MATRSNVNLETRLQELLDSPFELTQGLTEREKAGLETLKTAGDPTTQLASARDRFNEFTAPEVQSRLTAAGFGRTGAVGTSLAKAFAPVAGQIENQALQNRVRFGQAQIQAGGVVAGRADNQRTALLTRALKILQQIQTLRTNQAQINAASGANIRNFNQASRISARSGQGSPGQVNQSDIDFGGPNDVGIIRPKFTDQQIIAQRRAKASSAFDDLSQFNTGGTTSIFGPQFGGNLPKGTVLGGPGAGGTIRVEEQPKFRNPIFG